MNTVKLSFLHTLTLLCLAVGVIGFSVPASAQFDAFEKSCESAASNGAQTPAICNEDPSNRNPIAGDEGILMKAANIIAVITGITAVIVIIVAGMTMTLSSGDSSKIRSSRDAIIYATIGLVVAGLARTLVVFLVGRIKR